MTSFEPITKAWLFDPSNEHIGQTKGIASDSVTSQIRNSDVDSSEELGEIVRNPDGLRG